MKRLFAMLLVLLLITGCSSAGQADAPAETIPEEPVAQEPEVQVEEPSAPEEPEATEEPEEPETPAEEAPIPLGSFEAQTLMGETVTDDIFAQADLIIVNVWATYCGSCKLQLPDLGKLDRDLEEVQVLGIMTDVIDQTGAPDPAQIELALEILEQAGCTYPNLVLNYSLAMLGFASLSAVPATLFVDSQGNLVGQGFFGALDEAGWQTVIAERLAQVQS